MSGKEGPAALRDSTNTNARRHRRASARLTSSVLEELWSLWHADPRVPSLKSRRLWAASRNADHRLVDSWFLRRRTRARRTGLPIPDGLYDLPLDPSFASEREQSATPTESELPDLPSDDTLVYPPDSPEDSSDTVIDQDTSVKSKGIETSPHKEVVQQSQPKYHHFQSKPSSADLCVAEDRFDKDASLFESPHTPVCNQGRGKWSAFTCVLCSTDPQGTPDESPSDSGAMSNFDSGGNSIFPSLRLDFSPDTLSELSAIPFLLRTPPAVPPNNPVNHRTVDDWTTADELGRLVNDGELDFSFLDAPHLACMELRD